MELDMTKDGVVIQQGTKYVVFDIETTGLSATKNEIIEIGAVKISNGVITERFSTYVNPYEPIPEAITKLSAITDQMVCNAPRISEILPKFMDFCNGAILVSHNASFDMSFIKRNAAILGIEQDFTVIDTLSMARILLPDLEVYKLDNIASAFSIALDSRHRAIDEAECIAQIFIRFVEEFISVKAWNCQLSKKLSGV